MRGYGAMAKGWLMAAALAAGLTACAGSVQNEPINEPLDRAADQGNWPLGPEQFGATIVGLAFSGGGMRASAFSHGVLQELDRYQVATEGGATRMTDMVGVVSGVSGGSVTAAYFGLKGREGLPAFRTRFLDRNAEQGFDTDVSLSNVLRIATDGGVNDRSRFPRWLDDNLFDGATYADLFAKRRPLVWISASDLYSRTPFVFDPVTFSVLCSDLGKVHLAEAVAASAAVPGVFVPLNVENFGASCGGHVPKYLQRGLADPLAPVTLKAHAQAMIRYRENPEHFRFIKLLDGGLTDNFGIHSLTVARADRDRPYMPMTAEQAVRVERFMFLVVDSGRAPGGEWPKRKASPDGFELAGILTDVAIDSGVYEGYDYFSTVMRDWRADIQRWRCSLSDDQVLKLRGSLKGWNCGNVTFAVGRVSFSDTPADLQKQLDAIPTRFVLPPESIDTLVEAGGIALRNNAVFRAFLRGGAGRIAQASARSGDKASD